MRKIYTLFLSVVLMTIGQSVWAEKALIEHVQIGDLYYHLNTEDHSAVVTWDKYIDTLNYHGLKEAVIPASVTYEAQEYAVTAVDSCAFSMCDSLRTIQIPEGVTRIGNHGFRQSVLIESVVIPTSVTEIGDNAFYMCFGLQSVTIGDAVTEIGMVAFGQCTALKAFTCHSVTPPALGMVPFFQVDLSAATLYVPEEALEAYRAAAIWNDFGTINPIPNPGIVRTKIDDLYYNIDTANHVAAVTWDRYDRTSNYHGLKSITIPESVSFKGKDYPVTAIDTLALSCCDSLETLVMANSVTDIRYDAVSLCDVLKNVSFGSGVKRIGNNAFAGCKALEEIILPDNVEFIGDVAFRDCHKAARVVIGSGVTVMGERPFQGCKILTAFEVSEQNTHYCAVDGVLMDREQDTLINYPGAKAGAYIVPASITVIGAGAFFTCENLTAITLPEGLTSIGVAAFDACRELTELVIPNGVTEIPNAFVTCSSLKSVIIGNAVTSIAMTAFAQCTALERFTCYTVTPPVTGTVPFFMVNLAAATLYVPAESVEAYRTANTWKEFGTITGIPSTGIERIQPSDIRTQKLLQNGQLLIRKGDRIYTLTGSEIR